MKLEKKSEKNVATKLERVGGGVKALGGGPLKNYFFAASLMIVYFNVKNVFSDIVIRKLKYCKRHKYVIDDKELLTHT